LTFYGHVTSSVTWFP